MTILISNFPRNIQAGTYPVKNKVEQSDFSIL